MKQYDLSIRDVGPHPDAIRLTGQTPDGLPSGSHTGGAWLWNDEVWKPLDARPYANCPHHFSTLEYDALLIMQSSPLFPLNWRGEERNGREFIVRPKAYIGGEDWPYGDLELEEILIVEDAVRALNLAGFVLGDEIALARDPGDYNLFFYDLSNVQRIAAADDFQRITKFMELCGFDRLANLRKQGSRAICPLAFSEMGYDSADYHYVYASMLRPASLSWMKFGQVPVILHNPNPKSANGLPHSWIICKDALSPEEIRRYELTFAYRPLRAV